MSNNFRVSSLNHVKNIPSAKSNPRLTVANLGQITFFTKLSRARWREDKVIPFVHTYFYILVGSTR